MTVMGPRRYMEPSWPHLLFCDGVMPCLSAAVIDAWSAYVPSSIAIRANIDVMKLVRFAYYVPVVALRSTQTFQAPDDAVLVTEGWTVEHSDGTNGSYSFRIIDNVPQQPIVKSIRTPHPD